MGTAHRLGHRPHRRPDDGPRAGRQGRRGDRSEIGGSRARHAGGLSTGDRRVVGGAGTTALGTMALGTTALRGSALGRAVLGLTALGLVAFVATSCSGHGSSVPEGARTVAVRGESFRYSPEEVTVRQGEPIAIELDAVDLEHDYVSDELDLHVHAGAGETQRGGFTATTPGTYTVYCSISGHREAGMEGRIVVTPT